jgi:hypothetical protein
VQVTHLDRVSDSHHDGSCGASLVNMRTLAASMMKASERIAASPRDRDRADGSAKAGLKVRSITIFWEGNGIP